MNWVILSELDDPHDVQSPQPGTPGWSGQRMGWRLDMMHGSGSFTKLAKDFCRSDWRQMELVGNIRYAFMEVSRGTAHTRTPFTSPRAKLGDVFSCIKWWSRVVWGVAIGLWISHLIRAIKCGSIAGPYTDTSTMTLVEVCVNGLISGSH